MLAAALAAATILQIYKEPLRTGAVGAYDAVEAEGARLCARLRCPHAYLALESQSGPKEVWWLNGYDSPADKQRVADAWAASPALGALRRNAERKAPLVDKGE